MLPMYPTEGELPKYPTQVEPAIWLQGDEELGHGDCGCTLAQYDGARLNYCTMHAAAPELLEALARFLERADVAEQTVAHQLRLTPGPDQTIADAVALLRRARGEAQ